MNESYQVQRDVEGKVTCVTSSNGTRAIPMRDVDGNIVGYNVDHPLPDTSTESCSKEDWETVTELAKEVAKPVKSFMLRITIIELLLVLAIIIILVIVAVIVSVTSGEPFSLKDALWGIITGLFGS